MPASGQPVMLRVTSPQALLGLRPDGAEGFDDFGNGFDREPVELDILADGDIGEEWP